ncbi:ferric-dicitrate binding protein FerR (iron transport regulator) [Chitinophaga dinghuensis]|uniref:Ferric-dicitrate binding protein FerR (Iron transport regulator) n=1 Tax=Chitinophaga dinghuensis TaxID=1539050 RepID=A0A327VSZ1_9BACT|nr:FecR domain-containing protein [Chitinophaga dinghuensis]RAJ79157.1 ferric-dicitrate binding protein FerR (iron transport regulator) [Chitinophaga dinghuensis]
MEPTNYELITKKLSGQISPDENLELSKWLENKENQAEFEQLSKIWNDSKVQPLKRQYNASAAWAKVDAAVRPVQQETARIRPMRWKFAAAAAVLVVLTAAAWWMLESPSRSHGLKEIAANEGKIRALQLDDHSTVTLRPGSSLKYTDNYEGNKRVVNLLGEAYFEITTDAARPFLVKTPDNAVVEVLGTSFAVETSDSSTIVVVTEGKVKLSRMGEEDAVILTSGRKGIIKNGQVSAIDNDNPNFLAWKTGTLQFNDQTLVDIVPQLADFYGKEIRIEESYRNTAAKQKATISFRNQSCDAALNELQLLLGFKYRQEGDSIVISQ